MNRIYKVVWNKVRNCYVVGSEFISSHSAGKSSLSGPMRVRALVAALAACGVLAMGISDIYVAAAEPTARQHSDASYVAFACTDSAVSEGTEKKFTGYYNNEYTYVAQYLKDENGNYISSTGENLGKEESAKANAAKYWVRVGYDIMADFGERYTGGVSDSKELPTTDLRVQIIRNGNWTEEDTQNLQSDLAVEYDDMGVRTLNSQSLISSETLNFKAVSNTSGKEVPLNWNYMIYDKSTGKWIDVGTSADKSYWQEGTTSGEEHFKKHFDSDPANLVWNEARNCYFYKGVALDNSDVYAINMSEEGKDAKYEIGVFLDNDGNVYTGSVFGGNNEILISTIVEKVNTASGEQAEHTVETYWGGEQYSPDTLIGEAMTIGQFNEVIDTVNDNIVKVHEDNIKKITLTPATGDNATGGTLGLITNGTNGSDGGAAIPGAVTITNEGGTEGKDLTIKFANTVDDEESSFNVNAGSIVSTTDAANSDLTNLTINGQTYNVTDYRLINGTADLGTDADNTIKGYQVGDDGMVAMVVQDRNNADKTHTVYIGNIATKTSVDTLDDFAVKYDKNENGTVNYSSVTLGGTTYNNTIKDETPSGGKSITNVAYAETDKTEKDYDGSAAVNVDVLNDAIQDVSTDAYGLKDDNNKEIKQDLGKTIQVVGKNGIETSVIDAAGNDPAKFQIGLGNAITLGEKGEAGKDGKDGSITIIHDNTETKITLDGKDGADGITRIVYQDADSETEHTVATLDDIWYAAVESDGAAMQVKPVNNLVKFVGKTVTDEEGTEEEPAKTHQNIKVESTENGEITFDLADSIVTNNITAQAITSNTISATNMYVTNVDTTSNNSKYSVINKDYFDTYDKHITNVMEETDGIVKIYTNYYLQGSDSRMTETTGDETKYGVAYWSFEMPKAGEGADFALQQGSTVLKQGTKSDGGDTVYGYTVDDAGIVTMNVQDKTSGTTYGVHIGNIATKTSVDTLDDFAVKYDKNGDGTVNYSSVTLGDENNTYKKTVDGNTTTYTGGTSIKNVAYASGNDGSEVVNVDYLTDAIEDVSADAYGLKDEEGKTVTQDLGDTIQVVGKNGIKTAVIDGTETESDKFQISLDNAITLGEKGEAGAAGKDGSITIIHDNTETTIKLDGKDGKDGADGITRIVYKDAESETEHTVATLEDIWYAAVDKNGEAAKVSPDKNNLVKFVGKTVTDKEGTDEEPAKTHQNIKVESTEAGEITFDLNDVLTIGTSNNITVDGTMGTINGLTNKTWDAKSYVSGQAATEDQLKAVQDALNTQDTGNVKYDTTQNKEGETVVNYNSVTLGGDTYNTENHTGGTSITNVAYASGENGSEAVNVDYLNDTIENTKAELKQNDQHLVVNPDSEDGKYSVSDTNEVTLKVQNGVDENNKPTYTGVVISDVAKASDVGDVSGFNKDLLNTDTEGNVTHTTVVEAVNKIDKKVGDTQYTSTNYVTQGDDVTTSISTLDAAIKNAADTAAKHNTVIAGDTSIVVDGTGTNDAGGIEYKVSLADDITAKTVTTNTITVGEEGETGEAGKDGKNGEIKIVNADGTNTTITITKDGKPGVDGKDGETKTRIEYVNQDGDKEQVATLDDGMKFGGDSGTAIAKKLNEQLDIKGGATGTLTENNIGVVSDGTQLNVKLAQNINLGTDGSVTTGQTVINNTGVTINNKQYITNEGINANSQTITNVKAGDISSTSTDAVNGSQLYQTNQQVTMNTMNIDQLSGSMNKLDNRVKRVGAGAAALAALHPLDFDPDAKWDFAAGYGNYCGANAVAVGTYYRPNEDTMFSVGGSFGGGENMVNAGVSLKIGAGSSHVNTSKVAMAKEIKDMRAELEALKSALLDANAGKKIDTSKLQLFPDVPENHWAYEYVATLAGNGIIEGYPDGSFSGDRPMTRYEFAAMLYRAMLNGATLSDKILTEFAPELERFTVDTIAADKDGNPTIERVRVVKAAK